jgi:hypothetical protein
MKGSILARIVKDISLASYSDDTPLSAKVDKTLKDAIPPDVYGWFMGEVCPPILSGSQGLKLIGWLFKNVKRAELNLVHIKMIRQARREQFIDIVKDNLPTPAVMAHVTIEQLEAYTFNEDVGENLIPYIAEVIKRDRETVMIALQWSLRAKYITDDDLKWMLRYCRPVSEYTQLLLI